MKDWIKELCPEIANWQVELIAEQFQIEVAAEREACARVCEVEDWSPEICVGDYFAELIRSRSKK